MKQIAVKQLDLLRHVASGFQEQTDHLQQISDDIGANLNMLAQSFVKLSDVIKDGHTRSNSQNQYLLHIRNGVNKTSDNVKNLCWSGEELRFGGKEGKSGEVSAKAGSLLATLNRNLPEMLEGYPQNVAALTDEITKSFKSLEMIMKEGLEKKRPAEGPPQSEPKRVKFQHPGTKEEHTGTEKERDQKMAQWWAEIAAGSGSSASGVPLPPYGFPPPLPPGYFYGPPPSGTMPAPAMPAQPGQSP